jgi:hypothetical protein
MILMGIYKRGEGTIKKFSPVNTISEAKQVLEKYCLDNNVRVVARERFDTSYWNYLSDGTEFDYTIE